jgi:cytochrome bd ubiquinol oxidase subunit I
MNSNLVDPAFWSRLQFAFTLTYHYLFPQLTMGLAWFLVYWKWRALQTGEEKYNQAVRFWAKIFGLNFAVGVVTGIPMEFQFGTNWADFTRYAGGVIGQTLALGRKTIGPTVSLPRRARGCAGELAFRLLYSGH